MSEFRSEGEGDRQTVVSGSFPRQLGIVGLGIMGGSIARAVKAADRAVRVVAVELDPEARASALADGVVDQVLAEPGPELGGCELTVLCTPVASIESLLGPVSAQMPEGAVLTDVGGAKERIVKLAAVEVRRGIDFVGAHPMFGGRGGHRAARADLWRGGVIAVCEEGPKAAVERVSAFHAALGAKVVRCTAREHDQAAAMVSHLPQLIASSLALAAREVGPLALALAGSGLQEMTRAAQFPFDIEGELARRNPRLTEVAARFSRSLAEVSSAVLASPEAARAALEGARAARQELYPQPGGMR